MADFLTDIQTLRAKARQEIMNGPVTAAYTADLPRVIEMLNTALARRTWSPSGSPSRPTPR